jgi:hypothetical protein
VGVGGAHVAGLRIAARRGGKSFINKRPSDTKPERGPLLRYGAMAKNRSQRAVVEPRPGCSESARRGPSLEPVQIREGARRNQATPPPHTARVPRPLAVPASASRLVLAPRPWIVEARLLAYCRHWVLATMDLSLGHLADTEMTINSCGFLLVNTLALVFILRAHEGTLALKNALLDATSPVVIAAVSRCNWMQRARRQRLPRH